MTIVRTPVTDKAIVFPFGLDFQKSLLKLLTVDTAFAVAAMPYLRDTFFEHEALAWAYRFLTNYLEKYHAVPPLSVVMEETKALDPSVRELYRLTLDTVINADLSAEIWLRDKTLDFIKRNLFVESFRESKVLYNQGEVDKAYDIMLRAMDKIYNTAWVQPDREFHFDNFSQRLSDRLSADPFADTITTGIPELDAVLGGGLSLGELGIWVAYPKQGKSTILANHGVQAVRRGSHKVLHFVLEGSRKMLANRYDAIFSQAEYRQVKSGNFSKEVFERLTYDYQIYAKRLILRGLTERWDYTVVDLLEEIKELKRLYNWEPELIIVDYGDLLRGRGTGHRTETDMQRAAFRDLKSLANKGFAIWTASQARRPAKDIEASPEILQSRSISECYEKVRIADFIGTLNQTKEEREAKVIRLYAELYRDNEAGRIITAKADFSRMTITALRGGTSTIPLGYVAPPGSAPAVSPLPVQRKIPV